MAGEKFGVLFVCLGNICRSPLAEGVFRSLVQQRGYQDRLLIDSCGTGAWHDGEPPHRMSQRLAEEHGFSIADLRARRVKEEDFKQFSFVVAMDRQNLRDLKLYEQHRAYLCLLRDFDPVDTGPDVPDPFYMGNFEEVYQIIERSCQALLDHLEQELRLAAAR